MRLQVGQLGLGERQFFQENFLIIILHFIHRIKKLNNLKVFVP